MKDTYFGMCTTCGVAVNSRYHSLSRNVERHQYGPTDAAPQSCTCFILRSDRIGQYCSAACGWDGAYRALIERGFFLSIPGNGPVVPCAKCAKPIDLTQPHVAYELMDQTEIRQPWLLSVEPHDSETVARLCCACDGDLATEDGAVGADPILAEVLTFA